MASTKAQSKIGRNGKNAQQQTITINVITENRIREAVNAFDSIFSKCSFELFNCLSFWFISNTVLDDVPRHAVTKHNLYQITILKIVHIGIYSISYLTFLSLYLNTWSRADKLHNDACNHTHFVPMFHSSSRT